MAPITSYPDFGDSTTATEVANTFSAQIKGKYVLIVGVSPNSLGEHMALAIASHNPAPLILASRTASNMEEVIAQIKATTSTVPKPVLIDLSSQSSIRVAAKKISSLTNRLDVIINNAALNTPTYQTTKEGIEMHFGTNNIGIFLLTNLLLPLVLSFPPHMQFPKSAEWVRRKGKRSQGCEFDQRGPSPITNPLQ